MRAGQHVSLRNKMAEASHGRHKIFTETRKIRGTEGQ